MPNHYGHDDHPIYDVAALFLAGLTLTILLSLSDAVDAAIRGAL